MIQPGIYNILCPQGATFDRVFTVTVDGSLLDLTGFTAALQVREAADSAVAVISLTSGSGITLGGTAGTVSVSISAAITGAVAAGSYSYDLELYSGSQTIRLVQGAFNVSAGVTR